MDLSQWFNNQLNASAEGFIWAVDQVPVERRLVAPPAGLGEWNAARHVFHMLYYEQKIALPSMNQWLGRPFTLNEEEYDEDAAWGDGRDIGEMLADFRTVRAEQIVLLPKFDEALWHETREAVWGDVTLKWVVTKTFQHTAEHTHDVLRMALFWDMFEQHDQT
ncbi:MAG: DinB family protein [Chloroflexi bacterium]|nr:MAG: DinB family protein [Chloroflexota bacterium]